jgi:uncharacterized protein (UPF0333 family)
MDQRAQISIEYILLVAIILLVVLVFSTLIFAENEQNNVATAAQLGASNATAILAYTDTSQSPIKVTYVSMTNSNTTNNTINLVIHLSRPITNQTPILNSIANSLNNTLNSTPYNHTINSVQTSTSLTWTTNRYTYYITLS